MEINDILTIIIVLLSAGVIALLIKVFKQWRRILEVRKYLLRNQEEKIGLREWIDRMIRYHKGFLNDPPADPPVFNELF